MIKTNLRNDIYITKGDTLTATFRILNPANILATDTVTFSIKKYADGEPVISKTYSGTQVHEHSLTVVIPAAEMKELGVGRYFYGLLIETAGGEKITPQPLREFRIMEVAHHV